MQIFNIYKRPKSMKISKRKDISKTKKEESNQNKKCRKENISEYFNRKT